ncbi:LOW QUALITY PROTEIN: tRNA (cytosine(38)-C(5))-methyltransferase-like [Pollicipes pollicipes]|uniref:LOW QUALITY PROTEIN: tRNA (cytosine(38)-C(5))-methyltransferase-like n=1 Tax=Pollicipes pollicipes TaxID=41117 RepID=UPI001885914B|nr:LOW QUALITY PROTEIN: tRNA (cytosine(38)-C(5))-methyltransferase-like [Pollicipes pollicipes]
MNVLELYSGVGGMHMAAEDSGLPLLVVSAVDINTAANGVYRYNFPKTHHLQRNIQSFTADEMDKMELDVITMSPPCQPFSRLGRQADTRDARTSSFLHVLDVLPRMRRPPRYLLLENVRGFERSEARAALLDTLRRLGLHWRELLLSPAQLGVPNSRTRYYLLARRQPFPFDSPADGVLLDVPYCVCGCDVSDAETCRLCDRPVLKRLSRYMAEKRSGDSDTPEWDMTPTLGRFLAGAEPEDVAPLLLPDRLLTRYAELLDIVTPGSRRSCCFTSGYGHLVEGAGSVLLPGGADAEAALGAAFSSARLLPAGDARRADCLRPLQLRRFSPREVARLMCFPAEFAFPAELGTRQRYRLTGNSVNVRVVAALMQLLLAEEGGS